MKYFIASLILVVFLGIGRWSGLISPDESYFLELGLLIILNAVIFLIYTVKGNKMFVGKTFLLLCMILFGSMVSYAVRVFFNAGVDMVFLDFVVGGIFAVLVLLVAINFKELIKKRSLGLTAKQILFFVTVFSLFLNIFFVFKSYLPNFPDFSVNVFLLVDFMLSLVVSISTSWIFISRKRQEFKLLGFFEIEVDFSKDFNDLSDQYRFADLKKQGQIFVLRCLFDGWVFCRKENKQIFIETSKIIGRMKIPDIYFEDDLINHYNSDGF